MIELIDANPLLEPPELPARDGEWCGEAMQLWSDVWASPIEYTRADVHCVEMYVNLFHRYCREPSAELADEIRAQAESLGAPCPIDRGRLH